MDNRVEAAVSAVRKALLDGDLELSGAGYIDDCGDDRFCIDAVVDLRAIVSVALAAADGVGASEEDKELVALYDDTISTVKGGDEALITLPQGDLRRFLYLARRGAGQAVPDGWVLVPKEPTDSMCLAGYTAPCAGTYGCDTFGEIAKSNTRPLYLAMLAAAPKPETKE